MIDWYKKVVFENYANFKGRARRSEYWYYTLASIIISVILSILDSALGLKYGPNNSSGILNSVYSLLVFIPGLAVSVRRLHDIGKSGKLILLFYVLMIAMVIIMLFSGFSAILMGNFSALGIGFFVPLLFIFAIVIYMLILFCTEGDAGTNKYGPDPKSEAGEEISEIGVE